MAIAEQIADEKRIIPSDGAGVATIGATTKQSAPTLAVTTNQSDAGNQRRSFRCFGLSSFFSSISNSRSSRNAIIADPKPAMILAAVTQRSPAALGIHGCEISFLPANM